MDNQTELNLTEIFGILRKRLRFIFTAVIIAVTVCVIATFVVPPLYKASAKLIIQNETNLYPTGIVPTTGEDKIFLSTQKEIISSSFVINTALTELKKEGLFKGADYDWLKKRVAIDYLDDSNILEVKAYLRKSDEAVALANAITQAYVNYHASSKAELADKSLGVLNQELAVLKTEIDDLGQQLKALSEKDQLNFYQAQVTNYINNILELNKKNLLAEADISRVREELAKTTKANNTDLSFYYPLTFNLYGQNAGENPTASLTTVPWMQDIKKKISDAQASLSHLTAEYTDDYPEVVAMRSQITDLKDSLDSELKKVLLTYENYYNGYIQFLESQKKLNDTERARSETELAKLSANIDRAASKQIEFNALLKNFDALQDVYAIFLHKKNELQLLREQALNSNLPNIRIFELASLPLKPVSPSLPLNILLGLCLGAVIGIAGSLLEEKKESLGYQQKVTPAFQGERRGMTRRFKSLVVEYESGQVRQRAVSEDISGSGIRLRLKEHLSKDTELPLEIHISGKDSIKTAGIVIWIMPSGKDNFIAGLHFVKIEPGEREKLINYLYGEHYLTQRA